MITFGISNSSILDKIPGMDSDSSENLTSEDESPTKQIEPDSSERDSSEKISIGRKKKVISNGEILAQMKNRHEESVLNARLRSLRTKQNHREDAYARTRKQLIESIKKCRQTSGYTPDPYEGEKAQRVSPITMKIYQKPWAYSFNETTYNTLYKEMGLFSKRSFKDKSPHDRLSVKSAVSESKKSLPEFERATSAPSTEFNRRSSDTPQLLKTSQKTILRPQSVPGQSIDHGTKGHVSFEKDDKKRPQTCHHRVINKPKKDERKQSWIKPINTPDSNPISEDVVESNEDDIFVAKYLGNSPKVNRFLKKDSNTYVLFRGQKLKNYVRPQDRYKKDPLNLMKREEMVLKLSMKDTGSLEDSRKSALKAGDAFPKAARLRMLNQLIESNISKTEGPFLGYNAELQAKIERFLQSVDEFCESRSTQSAGRTRAYSVGSDDL